MAATPSLPSSRSARHTEQAIRVRLRYHAFYTANALTPVEIARFESAMADISDPLRTIRNAPPDVEARLRENELQTIDGAVREAFGEAAVPKMREYIATAALREVADQLAGHVFWSEAPLTGSQAERLVQACLDACGGETGGRASLDDVDWDHVLTNASSFLAPTQLDALRTMADMRRFDLEFRRATGLPYRSPVRNF